MSVMSTRRTTTTTAMIVVVSEDEGSRGDALLSASDVDVSVVEIEGVSTVIVVGSGMCGIKGSFMYMQYALS